MGASETQASISRHQQIRRTETPPFLIHFFIEVPVDLFNTEKVSLCNSGTKFTGKRNKFSLEIHEHTELIEVFSLES